MHTIMLKQLNLNPALYGDLGPDLAQVSSIWGSRSVQLGLCQPRSGLIPQAWVLLRVWPRSEECGAFWLQLRQTQILPALLLISHVLALWFISWSTPAVISDGALKQLPCPIHYCFLAS
jgi:hypothetical protein